jgi:hypothetical protein
VAETVEAILPAVAVLAAQAPAPMPNLMPKVS